MKGFLRRRNRPFKATPALRQIKRRAKQTLLQRHRRMVTVFGAFLVFTTFVVKEGIQQRLEERIEDVREARRSLNTLKEILRMELPSWAPLGFKGSYADDPIRFTIQVYRHVTETDRIFQRDIPTFEAMAELSSALHDDDRTLTNEFDNWKRYVSKEGIRFEEASSELEKMPKNERAVKFSPVYDEIDGFDHLFPVAERSTIETADKLSERAAKEELRLASASREAEYIGYALFVVGWLFAFAGKPLADVPVEP